MHPVSLKFSFYFNNGAIVYTFNFRTKTMVQFIIYLISHMLIQHVFLENDSAE